MRSLQTDGYLIRYRRESQGMNIASFAARVGISTGYLSRIENHHRNPTPEVTAAIATALGCTIEEITTVVQAVGVAS